MNNAWGMVKKNLTIHITSGVLCALVSFVGNAWLGCILGLAIYVTFLVMQYADGCDRGERACTMQATVNKLQSEGKTAEERMLKQTYRPANAVKAFLITSIPFAVLAAVNLILANPDRVSENIFGTVTRILFFPAAWATRLMTELVNVDFSGAIRAADAVMSGIGRAGVGFKTILTNMAGVDVFAVAYDLHYLTIMRVIFIPVAFLSPLAMMIGYFQGPRMRAKKLKEIEEGSRRKRKKLKVFNKKPRQPKQIKPEV